MVCSPKPQPEDYNLKKLLLANSKINTALFFSDHLGDVNFWVLFQQNQDSSLNNLEKLNLSLALFSYLWR